MSRRRNACKLCQNYLKGCTEALVYSAQEQALRTNYIKFHIDKTAESPFCSMCDERGENIYHLISECGKLTQHEYKRRHDNVARNVHWQISQETGSCLISGMSISQNLERKITTTRSTGT